FGADAPWFESNIPFFECADPEIEATYYYRWNLTKAHLRDLGPRGTIVTEFLDDVGWQRWPWASLNDATPFHIRETRWLRDRRYVDGYIDFLYDGGGNDRHFSEGIAAATFDAYEANGDARFATKHLGTMRHIYNLWDDHYDQGKGLYFIEPLLDATEYTISSIDASGAQDGFRGGDAFRPTINAYMYGNARAISRLSAMVGDRMGAEDYAARAERLKATVQSALWNPALGHFTDRYQVTNANVRYWEFIRGRELAGYVPWAYGLPDDTPQFNAAWRHLLDPGEFAGPYGLRTVGPGYEHYMRQYRYEGTHPECQWNGPSWPFQTTQVLTGLANLLNTSRQTVISPGDYLRLLRQYTAQHRLDGTLDLQEDYNPDTGRPIVGLDRSHHYDHSGYTD
ncbi:MAG: glycogen debranching protein, partial [Rhodococcus sp. (in: high G+C Gram-positive bacteria)]